jgi:hypothetical protein
MTEEEIDAYVKEVVDQAPPLTAAQRTTLAELLRPIREKYAHRSAWELAR